MTYIIIGLGSFGLALAERLTAMGHDVFGVDTHMELVEEYKDIITTTMCLNIMDSNALKALPLKDADEVVVTLSEDADNSLWVCALLKQAGVKRLVARATSLMHQTVLESMGIDEVITPERSAAELWALSSEMAAIKGAYIVSETYQILEVEIPSLLEGQSISEANLEQNFSITLISIKRMYQKKNFLGTDSNYYEVIIPDENFKFVANDRIIIYGNNEQLGKLKKALYK